MAEHRIKSTGGKGIKALLKRFKKPGTVDVGIIDPGKHEGSELNTAEIGYVHEFGSTDGTIPERSFIRSTLHGEDRKELIALSKRLLKKMADGSMDLEKALGLLGVAGADKISQKIVSIRTPPNSAATIRRKGSSNPLVDTGQLKNSITWRITK